MVSKINLAQKAFGKPSPGHFHPNIKRKKKIYFFCIVTLSIYHSIAFYPKQKILENIIMKEYTLYDTFMLF